MFSSSPHTRPKSSKELYITRQLFAKPIPLDCLTNRFTRRYTLYTRQIMEESTDEDSGEDDEPTESESSRGCRSIRAGWSRTVEKAPPHVVLLEMPLEILEQIITSIRDPLPILDAASQYIDNRYSDFSEARFTLSALSKVNSTLRRLVERILYRDVQLDFTGWKGRKHTQWPAGSLRLLLRTLEDRPELGGYIRSAALDYQLSSESAELEKGLGTFLTSTPNLKALFLGQCPLALWDIPLPKIVTFATTYAQGILPSILSHLRSLENLHLRDCHVMAFSLKIPRHRLKAIRLHSNHDYAVVHFHRALLLCSNTVQHLDLRFLGGLLHTTPVFEKQDRVLKAPCVENLSAMRLDNLSVFTHTDSGCGPLLRGLTSLRELYVSHHDCFAPDGFSILPSSLRKLTVSDYYGRWDSLRDMVRYEKEGKNVAFLKAFSVCIGATTRKMSSVVAAAGRGNESSELEVVSSVCAVEDPGLFKEVDEEEAFVRVFFL